MRWVGQHMVDTGGHTLKACITDMSSGAGLGPVCHRPAELSACQWTELGTLPYCMHMGTAMLCSASTSGVAQGMGCVP